MKRPIINSVTKLITFSLLNISGSSVLINTARHFSGFVLTSTAGASAAGGRWQKGFERVIFMLLSLLRKLKDAHVRVRACVS